MTPPSHRFLTILGLLFLAWSALLAIHPVNRADWILENVLVVIGLLILALTYRRFQFSRLSYCLIFCFLCIHEIGSHYTYALVPYDSWAKALTGYTINEVLGWERNHFDRLVHFLYGLLLAFPVRELAIHVVRVRGFWTYALPLGFTMATSLFYEQIEWAAALVFGGELGMAYLGTQGDIWDSHKDSLMASIGTLLSMIAASRINARKEHLTNRS